MNRVWMLHLAVLVLLLAAHFLLPSYHHGQVARIMVLAIYAMGYNILFGCTDNPMPYMPAANSIACPSDKSPG